MTTAHAWLAAAKAAAGEQWHPESEVLRDYVADNVPPAVVAKLLYLVWAASKDPAKQAEALALVESVFIDFAFHLYATPAHDDLVAAAL